MRSSSGAAGSHVPVSCQAGCAVAAAAPAVSLMTVNAPFMFSAGCERRYREVSIEITPEEGEEHASGADNRGEIKRCQRFFTSKAKGEFCEDVWCRAQRYRAQLMETSPLDIGQFAGKGLMFVSL